MILGFHPVIQRPIASDKLYKKAKWLAQPKSDSDHGMHEVENRKTKPQTTETNVELNKYIQKYSCDSCVIVHQGVQPGL